MSKPVRISDYLAEELQAIADRENRSLANLVQHLLTQALKMEKLGVEPITDATSGEVVGVTLEKPRAVEDPHFKPDFGKKL